MSGFEINLDTRETKESLVTKVKRKDTNSNETQNDIQESKEIKQNPFKLPGINSAKFITISEKNKETSKSQQDKVPTWAETYNKFKLDGFSAKEVKEFTEELNQPNISTAKTPNQRGYDIYNYVKQFDRGYQGYTGTDIVELSKELGSLKEFSQLKAEDRAKAINEVANLMGYKNPNSIFHNDFTNIPGFNGTGASSISGIYKATRNLDVFKGIKDPVKYAEKISQIHNSYNSTNTLQAISLHKLGIKPEEFNKDLYRFRELGVGPYEAAVFAMRGIKPEDYQNSVNKNTLDLIDLFNRSKITNILENHFGSPKKTEDALNFMKNELEISNFGYFRAEDYVHSYLTASNQLEKNKTGDKAISDFARKGQINSLLMQPGYNNSNSGRNLGIEKMDPVFSYLPIYTQSLKENFNSNFIIAQSRNENSLYKVGTKFRDRSNEYISSIFDFGHGNPQSIMIEETGWARLPSSSYQNLDKLLHDVSDDNEIKSLSYFMDPKGYSLNLCACATDGDMKTYNGSNQKTYAQFVADNIPSNSFVSASKVVTRLGFGLQIGKSGLPTVVLNKQSIIQGRLEE